MTARQIYALVYQLYGLTEDEIKIVEQLMKTGAFPFASSLALRLPPEFSIYHSQNPRHPSPRELRLDI